jgi:hypothetical protein
VTLLDSTGSPLDTVSYGPEGGDDQSLVRTPEGAVGGSMEPHLTVSAAPWSPGTTVDGVSY